MIVKCYQPFFGSEKSAEHGARNKLKEQVMRFPILLFVYLFLLGQIKAQSNESIVKTLPDTIPSNDNIGCYFKLPFFPQSTVSIPVDEMPMFPGGDDSLQSFISRNLILPEIYSKSNLHGIVWIPLIIDKDGSAAFCGSIFCEREFIKEALRLAGLMPRWQPAKVKKKNVWCDIIIPIYYTDQQ
jgi:hypothetical protein